MPDDQSPGTIVDKDNDDEEVEEEEEEEEEEGVDSLPMVNAWKLAKYSMQASICRRSVRVAVCVQPDANIFSAHTLKVLLSSVLASSLKYTCGCNSGGMEASIRGYK